jgi:hypothetical protein
MLFYKSKPQGLSPSAKPSNPQILFPLHPLSAAHTLFFV